MARLLISAAHTLENPGEVFKDLREADLTRKILKKTIPYLQLNQIDFQAVPLDLPLTERIKWINATGYSEEQGDILVEIHVNDGGKRGVEGWHKASKSNDNKSQRLTESIINGICRYTGFLNQGAKSEFEHELGSLLILNQVNLISSAVECLYIDNPDDILILKDDTKLESLAKAIADAIKDYFVLPPQPNQITSTQAPKKTTPILQGGPANGLPSQSFLNNPISGTANLFGNSPLPQPVQNPSSGGQKPLVLDREERKEMIKKIYKKILGKEPNQTDLNYYLNMGTNEGDLIKKLVEAPDHEKIVTDSLEAKDLKDKIAKMEDEVIKLKSIGGDLKAMYDNLTRLMQHKNTLIARLQKELADHNLLAEGQYIDSIHSQNQNTKKSANPIVAKRSFSLTRTLMKIFKI